MSYVYFISDGGKSIKIGFSTDVATRFGSIATMSPVALSLIGAVPGTRPQEQALHRELAAFRLNGEWFQDCQDVRRRIDEVLRDGLPALESSDSRHSVAVEVARELVDLIVEITGEHLTKPSANDTELWHGITKGKAWVIRYRPPKDLPVSVYEALLSGALQAVDTQSERLRKRRERVIELIEQWNAQGDRLAYLDGLLAEAEESLARLKAALGGEG